MKHKVTKQLASTNMIVLIDLWAPSVGENVNEVNYTNIYLHIYIDFYIQIIMIFNL